MPRITQSHKYYPNTICADCVPKKNKKTSGVATFHEGHCEACGKMKSVTEPRDFNYPTLNLPTDRLLQIEINRLTLDDIVKLGWGIQFKSSPTDELFTIFATHPDSTKGTATITGKTLGQALSQTIVGIKSHIFNERKSVKKKKRKIKKKGASDKKNITTN